jgi:uncharacterized membrane protein YGL010W
MRVLNLITVGAVLTAYGGLIYICNAHCESVLYDVAWCSVIALMLVQLFCTEKSLDFDKQFVFYASYHDHFMNQIVHLIFVWPILATALVFLSFTNFDAVTVNVQGTPVELHIGCAFFAACYFLYYVLLEKKAGVLAALFVVVIWVNAVWLSQGKNFNILSIAGFLHLAAWVAQFAGHGLLEGRAPALLDNLAQSFFMAPLFVVVEALSWCGYRKADFEVIKAQVQANIQQFNEEAARKQNQKEGLTLP